MRGPVSGRPPLFLHHSHSRYLCYLPQRILLLNYDVCRVGKYGGKGMPKVGKKKFPYTVKGKAAAVSYAKKKDKRVKKV